MMSGRQDGLSTLSAESRLTSVLPNWKSLWSCHHGPKRPLLEFVMGGIKIFYLCLVLAYSILNKI
jgi:hypothetical protein